MCGKIQLLLLDGYLPINEFNWNVIIIWHSKWLTSASLKTCKFNFTVLVTPEAISLVTLI